MSLQNLLILLAAICFFIAAFVWDRFSDRLGGVSVGWFGLFLLTLGVWLLK